MLISIWEVRWLMLLLLQDTRVGLPVIKQPSTLANLSSLRITSVWDIRQVISSYIPMSTMVRCLEAPYIKKSTQIQKLLSIQVSSMLVLRKFYRNYSSVITSLVSYLWVIKIVILQDGLLIKMKQVLALVLNMFWTRMLRFVLRSTIHLRLVQDINKN